ncbi:MAG TPA: hypothetical protein VEC99_17285 [Clostridia bacterium]|nr:hypothetical protein [Clostridia bacterium]
MLVLLRKRGTHLYYCRKGRWGFGEECAIHFESVEEALLFNRREQLKETEIVIVHSNEQQRKVLPTGSNNWTTYRWRSYCQAGKP